MPTNAIDRNMDKGSEYNYRVQVKQRRDYNEAKEYMKRQWIKENIIII